jgi:uncharacterized protein with von Willebrand factor type A (vWA) domain
MFLAFFTALRAAKVPVTLREYLTLLEALDRDVADKRVEDFYFLSRACLVKDERNLDRFDRGVSGRSSRACRPWARRSKRRDPRGMAAQARRALPHRGGEAQIEAMGWDKLSETLKERLEGAEGRTRAAASGSGTAGPRPTGAYGYNPEGRPHRPGRQPQLRAVKVWDKREFKDLADDVELGVRNMRWPCGACAASPAPGAAEELDLDGTIRETANKGYLDVKLRPERRNAVKVLLFLDVGGSMDWHVEIAEELFSAARLEFKHFEHFYFHNCLYERVWKQNRRRFEETIPTLDILRTYGSDYRVVFVGDASMSPYEITMPGGSVEHWNEEAGQAWMERLLAHFPKAVWLNPVPEAHWDYTQSIGLLRRLVGRRMYPLTLEGIDAAMRELVR